MSEISEFRIDLKWGAGKGRVEMVEDLYDGRVHSEFRA